MLQQFVITRLKHLGPECVELLGILAQAGNGDRLAEEQLVATLEMHRRLHLARETLGRSCGCCRHEYVPRPTRESSIRCYRYDLLMTLPRPDRDRFITAIVEGMRVPCL